MSETNAQVTFGVNTDELESGMARAREALSTLGETAETIGEGFVGLGEIIAEAFAVEKLSEFTDKMAELGEQIEHTASITGLSVDQVQQFQNIVRGTGGSVEVADNALTRLSRNIAEAASGELPRATEAFQRLGVSQQELQKGDLNQIMETMAVTMHNTADGANKVQAVYETIGRSGAQLIPVFDLGAEGIEKLNKAFEETGADLGESFADKLEALAQQLYLSQGATQGVANAFMQQLLPSVSAAAVGFTQMKEEFSQSIASGGTLADVISYLGDIIDGTVAAIDTLIATFKSLWDIGVGTLTAIMDGWVSLGVAIDDIAHGKMTAAIQDFNTWQAKAMSDFKKGLSDADGEAKQLTNDLTKMMEASQGGKVGVGAGRGNPNNAFAAPSGKEDTKNDEAEKRSDYAETFATRKEYDELAVESGKMSNAEMYADLQAALLEEDIEVQESFERQMALYPENSAEYAKMLDQMQKADEKYQLESTKLTLQQTKEDQKAWTSAFDTINKSFDQMLTGILQGTQTMGQAFERMAGNLIISFTEAVAKMGLEWLKMEAQNVNATLAGNAQVVASNQATTTAGSTESSAAAKKSILQDAYESAAHVYADVSAIPYVGWLLAPPAAAGAFAAVAAFDSFDVGTDYVPHDMIAQIHEGERIIPAKNNKAAPYTGGDVGGDNGGGGDTHIHIHAMDSRDVKRFAQQHGAVFAKAISNSFRGGNRTVSQHI